jgi:hypothetical protein
MSPLRAVVRQVANSLRERGMKANRNATPEQRAHGLATVAMHMAEGDRERALALLIEAATVIRAGANGLSSTGAGSP